MPVTVNLMALSDAEMARLTPGEIAAAINRQCSPVVYVLGRARDDDRYDGTLDDDLRKTAHEGILAFTDRSDVYYQGMSAALWPRTMDFG